MEPILEFNYKFEGDEEEHIINIQTKSDLLIISIELESKGLYWYKELDSKTLSDVTSQMGSYKSLKVFTDMLIQALSKKNESLSLNFYSLKEIQKISEPYDEVEGGNDIREFLLMVYTSFEKIIYPIKLDFLGNNPTKELMQRTIFRLRNKVNKLKEENKNLSMSNTINKSNLSMSQYSDNIPINYNEFERLKQENEILNNKIKLLEKKNYNSNDDIYKKYNELSEKYETYKKLMENKMNLLVSSLEELKEKETEKLNQEKEKEKNKSIKTNNKNISKILELEKKLEISSEQLLNERKQNSRLIEDKNREIDSLKKEVKTLKESEKKLKVKISNLEKELEREKKGSAYYKNKIGGNPASRKAKSYHSEGSVSCNESYISSYSKKTTTSFLKKNLIPNAYKNSYQRAKNYSPYGSKKKNNKKNSKSKSRSRSGSKKSSGSNSIVSKSIKGPNTVYQRTYKSPYKYDPKKDTYKRNSNSKNKNKNRISPSKNLIKKENNYIKNLNKNYGNIINNNDNEKINNINNINNNINNKENEKKDNLNEESNDIADRLSRIQALISQVSGK